MGQNLVSIFLGTVYGGVGSVKGMWVIIGFPIAFIMAVIIISAFRNAGKSIKEEDYMLDKVEK